MLNLTVLGLCSFQKCKILKLGFRRTFELKITETKFQKKKMKFIICKQQFWVHHVNP